MAYFELNDYLSTPEMERGTELEPSTKKASSIPLDEVSARKIQALDRAIARRRHNLHNTVANKLGLDPEGLVGGHVNRMATFANDVASYGRSGVALWADGIGSLQQRYSDDPTAGMTAKELAAKLRSRDLDIPGVPQDEHGNAESGIYRRAVADTGLSLMSGMAAVPEAAVGVGSMFSEGRAGKAVKDAGVDFQAIKRAIRGEMTQEARDDAAAVEAAEGFLGTAGEMLDRPGTIWHGVVESLPAMYGGAKIAQGLNATGKVSGAVAAGVGEGTVMAGMQAENIRNQNADGLLSPGQAAIAAGTGLIGGAIGMGGGALANRLRVGDIDQIAMANATRGARGPVTRTAGGLALEGGEELLQSGMETMGENLALGRDLTENLGDSMAQGLLTGSAMGGTMNLASRRDPETKAADALAGKDPEYFLDPNSKHYSPAKAGQVLMNRITGENVTEEQRVQATNQLTKVMQQAEADLTSAENQLIMSDPEQLRLSREYVSELKTQLSEMDPATQEAKDLGARIQNLEAAITEQENLPEAQRKKLEQAVIKARQQVEALKVFQDHAQNIGNVTAEKVSQEVPEAPVTSAEEQTITLTWNSPDKVSPEQATEVANDTSNSLTQPQRDYLQAYAKARAAEEALKGMGDVSRDVLNGGPGFIGLNQYRAQIGTALKANDLETAQALLEQLERFARDRIKRFTAVRDAKKRVDAGEVEAVHFARMPDGSFRERAPFKSEAERKAQNGLTVSSRSSKLLREMAMEADVARKAVQQARMGIAAAQQPKTPKGPEKPAQPKPAPKPKRAQAQQTEAQSQAVPAVQETPATEENTGIAEEAPVDAEQQEAVTEQPKDGKLTVFQQEETIVPKGENYTKANLVRYFFRQNGNKLLVKEFNALSRLQSAEGQQLLKQYLGEEPLTADQSFALNDFLVKAKAWAPSLRSLLARKQSPEFNYQNLMTFFMDEQEQPDIDENLKTAIAAGLYTWITENGSKLFNEDSDINNILGRDSRHDVGDLERGLFSDVGSRERLVANSMGQRVYQALGLTTQNEIPQNLRPQLIAHLGAYAVTLGVKEGLLERKELKGSVFEGLDGVEFDSEQRNAVHAFIRPATQGRKMADKVAQIVESNRGTEGIVGKLFNVDTVPVEPSLSPQTFKQKQVKNGEMLIPELMREIQNAEQQKPHEVNHDMLHVVQVLDRDLVEAIAGVDHTPESLLHKSNRNRVAVKNQVIRDELDNALSFFEKLRSLTKLDEPFFFQREVWRQQRVGLRERLVNPQASKVQRHLVNMQGWRTTVKFSDENMVNQFKIAVMEAMGIKTDKQSNEKTVADFNAWYTKNQAAITAMHDLMFLDHVSPIGQQAIREAVVGKEGMFSLDALVQVAKFKEAQDAGRESFVTQFFREVDGKTNGPILTILQLGAAANSEAFQAELNRGGLYSQDDEPEHYSDYRTRPGAADLYEMLTKRASEILSGDVRRNDIFKKVSLFTGDLTKNGDVTSAGRNLVKTPLTAIVFGSGIDTTVNRMAEDFIQKIYDQIEEIARQNASNLFPDSLKTKLEQINGLLPEGQQLDVNMSLEQAVDLEFSDRQLAALKDAFNQTVGFSVRETLKEKFAVFLKYRDLLNNAAQTSFELYSLAYRLTKKQLVKELMDAGELPFRVNKKGEKVPVADITDAQEQELRARLKGMEPVAHTPLSKMTGDLNAGLLLAKEVTSPSTDPLYGGELNFAEGSFSQKYMKVAGYTREDVNPGVAALIMMIHSSDSAISALAYQTSQALNVHDAHGLGLWEVEAGAKRLNQNTFTIMRDYSAPSELFAALERTVNGMAELVYDGELDLTSLTAQDKKALIKVLSRAGLRASQDVPATTQNLPLPMLLQTVKRIAYQADHTKLTSMAKAKSYDQYSLEGGSYKVTQEDRDSANSLLLELSQDIDQKTLGNAEFLSEQLGLPKELPSEALDSQKISRIALSTQAPAEVLNVIAKVRPKLPAAWSTALDSVVTNLRKGQSLPEAVRELDVIHAAEMIQALGDAYATMQHTEVGEVGAPAMGLERVNAELEQALAAKPVMPARELMSLLSKQLQGKGNLREMQRTLLKELFRTLPQDLQIHYVTQDTSVSELKGDLKKVSGARGWYVAAPDGQQIFLRSSEFTDAGVIPEVILHELVHAAVTRTVRAAQKAGKGEVFDLVQDLERIRAKAGEVVREKGLESQYGHVVSNLDEFIAWGMTNITFQRDVLNQFSLQSKTKGNSLIKAAKQFWDTLTKLIFRNSDKSAQQRATRALTLVMKDVAGLFEAARQQQEAQAETEVTLAYGDASTYSTQEIHDLLAQEDTSLDPFFKAKLGELVENVVTKLHGPFGAFKVEADHSQPRTGEEIIQRAMDSGVMPFATQSQSSHFRLSNVELHAIEQMEVALRAGLDRNSAEAYPVIRTLEKLFKEARQKITVQDLHQGDWNQATPDEKEVAQAKWNHLFKVEGNQDDHLARFAALALGTAELQSLMQFNTQALSDTSTGHRWLDALYAVLDKILRVLNGRLVKAYAGQRADEKLGVLIHQLVDIDAKHRIRLARSKQSLSVLLDRSMKGMSDAARERVEKFGKSAFFQNSSHITMKAFGATLSAVAGDRAGLIMEGLQTMRDNTWKTRQGMLASLMTEARGQTDSTVHGHILLQMASRREQIRQQIKAFTGKAVLEGFADKGRYLTEDAKEAITKTLLRTDLQALLDHFQGTQLTDLIINDQARKTAIADFESKLAALVKDPAREGFYTTSAKETAYMMVTGKATGKAIYRNVQTMARMWGSSNQGKISDADAKQIEAVLDPLVSLYALDYSPSRMREQMKEVIQKEQDRPDQGSGIELTLLLHRQLQQDARERVFKGSEALMVKGHTPDIHDPQLEVAVVDQAEGADLELAGWTKVHQVKHDPADPDQTPKALYVVRSGGAVRRQTGAFSLTSKHAQGTQIHSGIYKQDGSPDVGNRSLNNQVWRAKLKDIDAKFKANPSFDPRTVKDTFMVPIFNPKGRIVSWRHMMEESTKDSVLARNNSFDDILGTLASQTFDKESTPEQNRKAIQALKDQYDSEYLKKANRYVKVGPNSQDPEQVENWRLLPDETKQMIKEIWGQEDMYVRIDMLDMMFGYRKVSLANAFAKDRTERNIMEKLLVVTAEILLKKAGSPENARRLAALRTRQVESVWQEVVQEVKDILVIRNISTLLGNIQSNLTLLLWYGVGIKDLIRNHRIALAGAIDFRRDTAALVRLQALRSSGYAPNGMQAVEQEIAELEDALRRNPVRELIEAGLMPTIVEDVGMEDTTYTYKSLLANKLSPITSKIPAPLKTAAKWVYLSKETAPYQFLNQATQLSDFVGRYTLYQHLINRPVDPVSKEDAIQQAAEAFIYYDVPTHRNLQYLNDMGIVPFTKYYVRIQKIILRLFKENPARALALFAANAYVDGVETVMESSFLNRIGNNPAEWGALQYPTVLDELPLVKLGLSPFN